MSYPNYQSWALTAHGLHKGAQLLGAVQRLTQPPLPAYQELGLQVQKEGFVTGVLPAGSRLLLDLTSGSLVLTASSGRKSSYPLNGRTQAEAFTELFGALASNELAPILPAGSDLFERVSNGIAARGKRYQPPQRATLVEESVMTVDLQAARDYLELVQQIYTGTARFLAHLSGMRTSLIVWPHGFDLSSLSFMGSEIDESQPHMNFGFSPFSAGMNYAYLYAYAHPYPQRFEPPPLPKGARWNSAGWTGMLLPYEELVGEDDLARAVENSFTVVYKGLRSLLESN
jgi:hypothetical protein